MAEKLVTRAEGERLDRVSSSASTRGENGWRLISDRSAPSRERACCLTESCRLSV